MLHACVGSALLDSRCLRVGRGAELLSFPSLKKLGFEEHGRRETAEDRGQIGT